MTKAPLTGTCHALYAFDVAYAIRLSTAARILDVAPTRMGLRKHRRSATDMVREPLRWRMETEPAVLAGGFESERDVDVTIHGFGGVSIGWRFPLSHGWSDGIVLAEALHDSTVLQLQSRALAERLLGILSEAAERPGIAELCEDYSVLSLTNTSVLEQLDDPHQRARIAMLLRAEEGELSEQEQAGALSDPISYHPDEACFVDWMSAILFGPDMEQELHSLELANLELLELRVLDRRLQKAVAQANLIAQATRAPLRRLLLPSRSLNELALLRADFAGLHENADNAVEAFGDDYLARVYRRAAERFHFAEWDASIERKLGLLDDMIGQFSSLAATRRGEILEWIIILLIAVEIVLYFAERA
jgi:hypothetical protein